MRNLDFVGSETGSHLQFWAAKTCNLFLEDLACGYENSLNGAVIKSGSSARRQLQPSREEPVVAGTKAEAVERAVHASQPFLSAWSPTPHLKWKFTSTSQPYLSSFPSFFHHSCHCCWVTFGLYGDQLQYLSFSILTLACGHSLGPLLIQHCMRASARMVKTQIGNQLALPWMETCVIPLRHVCACISETNKKFMKWIIILLYGIWL